MNGIKYEHHSSGSFINELCPFKIKLINTQKNIGANWHANPEIIYITGGEGKVICESEAFPARKGDIFVIPPETIHQIIAKSELEYCFIITDVKFWTENGVDPEQFAFEKHFRDSGTEELIDGVIASSKSISSDKADIACAVLRKNVLSLIIDICQNHASGITEAQRRKLRNSDSYVKAVMQYINQNYSRPLTTVEIAGSVGITQSYLSREFKRSTGETVVSYINILRCKRAGQLIMRGYSVTEAALESGFESGSYFSQIYKKITGRSPKDIKNKDGTSNASFYLYTDDYIDS